MDVIVHGRRDTSCAGRCARLALPYRPVLAVLLLPSLLLIGVFSYYPAVRSLIGGFYQWNGFSAAHLRRNIPVQAVHPGADLRDRGENIAILVGGSILITLVSQFTAAEIVTHMPRRAGAVAKYLLVLPIVLPPLMLIEVWAYLLQPSSGLVDRILARSACPSRPGSATRTWRWSRSCWSASRGSPTWAS